jgi:hypothetical protein
MNVTEETGKEKKRRELLILRAGELATYIVRSYPAESSLCVIPSEWCES